jgi:hypothetical protein
LRCWLTASLRSFAFYALTAILVAAATLAGLPRPLASAIAAELPASRPIARAGLTTPDSESLQSVAAAENADTAPAIEPTAFWAKTKRETAIWSGWDANAKEFAKIAQDLTVQVLELHGPRAYVYFSGDTRGHKAGEVWIDRSDLSDLPWPRWARAKKATILRSAPDLGSEELLPLTRGSYVETTGEIQGRWAQAFFLMDRQPGEWAVGWVDGLDLTLPRGDQTEMSSYMLTRTSLLTSTPDVWLKVPYRTQLDGSSYAEANCGPTSIGMALDAIGKRDTLESLRTSALQFQDMNRCDDCGTFIQHLARVVETRGATAYGLRDDPENFHRWSLDEIRQQIRQERVVIPQVKFRLLPGRTKSLYGGDHYIVLVGLVGNNFVYNDPVDSDGRGYGRLITADQLEQAMTGANGEFSRAAFAVGK